MKLRLSRFRAVCKAGSRMRVMDIRIIYGNASFAGAYSRKGMESNEVEDEGDEQDDRVGQAFG